MHSLFVAYIKQDVMEKRLKMLLCRPAGGFNDILCRIESCWRYAELHDRLLIVDTTRSSLACDFDDYFSTQHPGVKLRVPQNLLKDLDRVKVFPHCLSGRLSTYKAEYKNGKGYVDSDTNLPVRFDLKMQYEEDLLVYENSGGGGISINCLERLQLHKHISLEILSGLSGIHKPYDAIHIRNTDMKTDYINFFKNLYPYVDGHNVLICSDDQACRVYAKKFFTKSNVMTVTEIPDTQGKALHFSNLTPVPQKNLAMLTDLFALAMADKLFTIEGVFKNKRRTSGFSSLACKLHKQQCVCQRLLYGTKSDLSD